MEVIPGLVKVPSLAHVIHLCGHHNAIGTAAQAWVQQDRFAVSVRGQAGGQRLEGVLGRVEVRSVSCDVDDVAGCLRKNASLQGPQLLQDFLPMSLLDLFQDISEVVVLCKGTPPVPEPSSLAGLCRQLRGGDTVAGGDQGRLGPGAGLAGELDNAILVVKVCGKGDLLHEVREIRHLSSHGLAPHDEVSQRLRITPLVHAHGRRGDASGAHAHTAGEAHEIPLGGAQLLQGPGEEGH
mmetsp:Transcript_46255/g.86354  ORF Transcript_46255/g.86354 Transcript_46255/m.86354 type:complete len:238 (-) Transcript_46255:2054-2767(-)